MIIYIFIYMYMNVWFHIYDKYYTYDLIYIYEINVHEELDEDVLFGLFIVKMWKYL